MLSGRMMDFPLTIAHLLERAGSVHGHVEVVSTLPDKTRHRGTFAELHERSARLANALTKLGVKAGDRVATFAWNHRQHLECYLGVPAMGAVVHTLNLRLHPTELAYIANHADDQVVVVDLSLWPLFDKFRGEIKNLRHVLVVRDTGGPAPEGTLDYEAVLADASPTFDPPALDENAAAMLCYTSGTTGNPKGVLYSHRSTVLHAMIAGLPDAIGLSADDVVLPVVPMFHASAWGLPYVAALTGTRIVFPGPHLDPASLVKLMAEERVTVAAGVPTIWMGILQLLDAAPEKVDLSCVRTMIIGGSAAPASMIEGFSKRHGLEVTHAWGMTETNPLGTVARVKRHLRGDAAKELALRATQGFAVPFVETRHVDSDGKVLALRLRSFANVGAYATLTGVAIPLMIGPWVTTSIYDIPVISLHLTAVMTNCMSTGAYRGAGRPVATYAI